ncbi:MAG: hypothetical protein FWF69_10340 [Firmicutes bacterium]|nr:hypothetical protein [Bacillota bacterium]
MITALCLLLSAVMAYTPLPSDAVTARMILVEVTHDNEANPSASRTDPGQCRRFQISSFAAASAGYRLKDYPDRVLYMPPDHAPVETSGRSWGVGWEMPGAETGNAFVEVARYDYNRTLSPKRNLDAAKAFLTRVRAGDVLQMVGTYTGGGHGSHTLLFTRPYDPRLDTLCWADSNFAYRMVDGKKYGVVRPYQEREIDEIAGWLAAMESNGATLYRVREDLVERKSE